MSNSSWIRWFYKPGRNFDGHMPGAAATITLSIDTSELGQMTLSVLRFFGCRKRNGLATGHSHHIEAGQPDGQPKEWRDPSLQREVSLHRKSVKS